MIDWHEVTFRDELLADQTVHRVYSDGREEWRRRLGPWSVGWRDNQGHEGVDELLGQRIVKRTLTDGRVVYGREQGFGRTAWSDRILTMNRTSFSGMTGALLAGTGAAALMGPIIGPPLVMTLEEEEALRRAREEAESTSEWKVRHDEESGDDSADSSGDFDDDGDVDVGDSSDFG